MRVHKIQKHNYKSVIAFCTFPPFRVIRENTKISLVSERYPTASKVVENLKTVPIGILPSNEAQVRPLTNLEPEQQCGICDPPRSSRRERNDLPRVLALRWSDRPELLSVDLSCALEIMTPKRVRVVVP
jgi:hypothetical protein